MATYKESINENGDLIQLVSSPWNARNFAILNRTKNTYSYHNDITEYAEAFELYKKAVKAN